MTLHLVPGPHTFQPCLHGLTLTTVLLVFPCMTVGPPIAGPCFGDAPAFPAPELIPRTHLRTVEFVRVVSTVWLAIAVPGERDARGGGNATTLELIFLTLPRLCQMKDEDLQ